jgi:hypothetical protein
MHPGKCLGKYQPISWFVRREHIRSIYRHSEFPDSLAYFIYKPTVNGSRVSAFTLETGKTVDNQVRKVSFLDNTDQGRATILKVQNGKIIIDVEEKPILILFKEPERGK